MDFAQSLVAELASVEERDLEMGLPGRGPATRDRRHLLAKCRYSHEAMINLIIECPWIQQNQLAVHFGRTPAWISTIMQTDAFKAQMALRQAEIVDPELRATARERFEALVHKSLQVLQEKLSRPVEQIPDNLALRAVELGAKGLGLGGFATAIVAPAPPASADRLETLASRLLELQGQVRRQATDAVIIQETKDG